VTGAHAVPRLIEVRLNSATLRLAMRLALGEDMSADNSVTTADLGIWCWMKDGRIGHLAARRRHDLTR
jgi:hypothetical protein